MSLINGENNISLTQHQGTELPYRHVETYWVLGAPMEIPAVKELEIRVDYYRDRFAVDDMLTCTVQVTRRGDSPIGMAIIDLGMPPGVCRQQEWHRLRL